MGTATARRVTRLLPAMATTTGTRAAAVAVAAAVAAQTRPACTTASAGAMLQAQASTMELQAALGALVRWSIRAPTLVRTASRGLPAGTLTLEGCQ